MENTFSNGLSPAEDGMIDDLRMELAQIAEKVENLGRHRSYSLAVTKIQEASLWLSDRKHKAA